MFDLLFLTPEYRRNIFFIYEKRLRVHSPPEKVFEYFSSVKSNGGTFMTSLDLMRAAVPVFQPSARRTYAVGHLAGNIEKMRIWMPFDWDFQRSRTSLSCSTPTEMASYPFQSTSSLSLCSPFLRARSRRFSSSSISTEAVNLAEANLWR